MGNVMILNGSPRAPKSNSRRYAELFAAGCKAHTEYFNLTKTNHQALCLKIGEATDVLLVFPLYADALPVTLLNFLKFLEKNPPENRPVVSVLVNCGFLEVHQNDVAVQMVQLFCKQNGYPFGSVLKIGSGEAILDTPFRFLAARKIRHFARSIAQGTYQSFQVTMPLTKKWFVSAAADYWIRYGKRNGVTKEQMQTMQIE